MKKSGYRTIYHIYLIFFLSMLGALIAAIVVFCLLITVRTTDGAAMRTVIVGGVAAAVALGVWVPGQGILAPLSAAVAAGVVILLLRRNLGGMSGDISGAAITLAELAGSAALLL